MQFSAGSLWRKWDLHVHSPLSILNNQFPKKDGQPDWEAYISRIEQTDLSVIGVTDYFTIDGYKKLLEFKKQGRLQSVDLIVPNIELRLNVLGNNKRINFHVIFSDKLLPEDIEEDFLHELYFTMAGNPQSTDDKAKLKIKHLTERGQRLKSENPGKYSSQSDLEAGATIAAVDHERVSQLLQSSKFKGNYILVLAEENLPPWHGQAHGIRQTLTQKADFIFTSNTENIRWYLGQKDYVSTEEYIKEFHSIKPCIHGSDAHELFFVGHPCTKRGQKGHDCKVSQDDCEMRYCWIKADPTFEGLKQVLYEPEDRVVIGPNDPTPSRQNHTLSKITLNESRINDELSIENIDLPLHRGLITVTGGRGAGKTAFVDLIANCFDDRVNQKTDNNSFVRRISGNDPDLRTTLEFLDADGFTKIVTEDLFIEETEIAYISQGELDHYITESTSLTKRIQELLFRGVREGDKYEYENLSNEIDRIEKQIPKHSLEIIELEQKTKEDVTEELKKRKKRAEADLKDIHNQIDEIVNNNENNDEIEKAQEIQKLLQDLRNKQEQLMALKQKISFAREFINKEVAEFNRAIDDINQMLTSLDFETNSLSKFDYTDLSKLDDLLTQVEGKIKANFDAIHEEQDKLNQQESNLAKHTKLLDEQSQKEKELSGIEIEFTNIQKLRANLESLVNLRTHAYKSLLDTIYQKQAKYTQIIEYFSTQLASSSLSSSQRAQAVLKDLEFFAEIQFDKEKFLKSAEDLFNNGRVNVRGDESDFVDIITRFQEFANGAEGAIDALSDKINDHTNDDKLRSKMKKNNSINEDDFFKVFFQNYFTVTPVVKYKNTSLERLSLGQKATVLMKIYLAQGRNPIIIDSHDDHLDNQFIMDELIPAIREAKKHRQIILVSNNANVVVNTDAEQIIIAERNGVTISFMSGSLENQEIREKALKVLEGGEDAFKQRQQKYRLS